MGDIFCTEDVKKLLKDKHLQILGSSNWRSVYKDLITLAQETKFIQTFHCKNKGEDSCQNDKLLTPNSSGLSNGTDYREKRLFQKEGMKISFEFITRAWNEHVQEIVARLKTDKPHILLLNSTLWDMSRYRGNSEDNGFIEEFKKRVGQLLSAVKENTDDDTLVIWCGEMPVGKNPNGAIFDNAESQLIAPQLGFHVELANDFVQKQIDEFGFDFIDFHFLMKRQMHRQVRDEVHWDNTGLRRVTNMLLTHISEAFGVPLPGRNPCLRGQVRLQDINQNQIRANEPTNFEDADDGSSLSPPLKHRKLDPTATATSSSSEPASTVSATYASGSTTTSSEPDNDAATSAAVAAATSTVLENSVLIDAIDDVNASSVEWNEGNKDGENKDAKNKDFGTIVAKSTFLQDFENKDAETKRTTVEASENESTSPVRPNSAQTTPNSNQRATPSASSRPASTSNQTQRGQNVTGRRQTEARQQQQQQQRHQQLRLNNNNNNNTRMSNNQPGLYNNHGSGRNNNQNYGMNNNHPNIRPGMNNNNHPNIRPNAPPNARDCHESQSIGWRPPLPPSTPLHFMQRPHHSRWEDHSQGPPPHGGRYGMHHDSNPREHPRGYSGGHPGDHPGDRHPMGPPGSYPTGHHSGSLHGAPLTYQPRGPVPSRHPAYSGYSPHQHYGPPPGPSREFYDDDGF